MIFQDFKLLSDRSIYENVALPLRIEGAPTKFIREQVPKVLEQVNLLNSLIYMSYYI